jgi:nucleoid-associated protein YgaU
MFRGVRCLAVWLAVTATVSVGLLVLQGEVAAALTDPWSGLPFDAVLVRGTAVVAAIAGAWVWLVTSVTAWEAASRHQRVPARGGAVRRLVLSACGVALVSGAIAVPAGATPGHSDGAGTGATSARGRLLGGLPLPDRASVPAVQDQHRPASDPVAVRPATQTPATPSVVVGPGDSLWSVAAATLPPGADSAQVDRRWRRIYAANRAGIGADPHHIEPGLRLTLPPS